MDTYKATNTTNGKFYIGSTKNFEKRKKHHLESKTNYPFQIALRKNPEAFEWEVWTDNSEKPILEQALLDMWFGCEQCYNLRREATGGNTCGGTLWWNNGKINKRSLERPGKNWVEGRLNFSGDSHPGSKLTSSQRKEIQIRGVPGFKGNVQELAKEFGVSGRLIRKILNPGSLSPE
jgi:hypothetical protein